MMKSVRIRALFTPLVRAYDGVLCGILLFQMLSYTNPCVPADMPRPMHSRLSTWLCDIHLDAMEPLRESSVRELSDEAFRGVTEVSFPVDKIVDCLRLLAGIYVSRGLDMHLLLFHEAAETDSIVDNNVRRGDSDTAVVAPTPSAKQPRTELSSASKHGAGSSLRPVDAGGQEKPETQGSRNPLGLGGSGGGGGRGADSKGVSGGPERRTTAAMAGKNGRFATAGRVRDFRTVLKGVAAHASKMKAAHANRELNLEGLIRGHDVDAAVLHKSTNPGTQSKQQIGRVARAREAVDNMLKRWPVVIERMGICTEQTIKIRSLVKTPGVLPGGGGGGASGTTSSAAAGNASSRRARTCAELRAAKEHAWVMEQHAEILVLSLRFERVALAIQRRQEEREYERQAALGLVPPSGSKH